MPNRMDSIGHALIQAGHAAAGELATLAYRVYKAEAIGYMKFRLAVKLKDGTEHEVIVIAAAGEADKRRFKKAAK